MSILDDRAGMEALDPSAMRGHLERFPAQLAEALELGRSSRLRVSAEGATAIVVLGMGGSAIGGELASGYLSSEARVPSAVVRGYELPAYVGPDTFVYVSSYSGNTEETLSGYAEAVRRGARIVCSTTGGRVAEMADEHGHDVLRIPTGYPPRAALGFGLVPLLTVLGRLGLAEDRTDEIERAARTAEEAVKRFGLDTPTATNPAKELALWLERRLPVVYGSAPVTSVVANRWCGQFSENSKVVAHRNELPEMNHNEIVGWTSATPLVELARVVFLRDVDEHPRVARRFGITRDAVAETGVEVREVESFGDARLGRLLSLVQMGDFISYYLSMLGGVDPTPVGAIDRLKKALAAS